MIHMTLPPISPELLEKAQKAAAQASTKQVTATIEERAVQVADQLKKTMPQQQNRLRYFDVREDYIDSNALKTKSAQKLLAKSYQYAEDILDVFSINSEPNYFKRFATSYVNALKQWSKYEGASDNIIRSVMNEFFKQIQDILNLIQQKGIAIYNLHIYKAGQLDEIKKGKECVNKALAILNGRSVSALSSKELRSYNKCIRDAEKHERTAKELGGFIPEANDRNIQTAKDCGLEREMKLVGMTLDSKLLHEIYDNYAKISEKI